MGQQIYKLFYKQQIFHMETRISKHHHKNIKTQPHTTTIKHCLSTQYTNTHNFVNIKKKQLTLHDTHISKTKKYNKKNEYQQD